jgi:hypothetical protein
MHAAGMARSTPLATAGLLIALGCGGAAPEPAEGAAPPPLSASVSKPPAAPPPSAEAPSADARAFIAALKPHSKTFRACYEREVLAKDPEATGSVALVFRVGRDGAVVDVRSDPEYARAVRGVLRDPAFLECLYQAARAIRFPEQTDTTTVVYPIVFKPNEPSRRP